LKFFPRKIAIPKYLGKKSPPYGFSSMYWDNCAPTIGMLKEMMTAFGSDNFNPDFA
jgi:hypothetical protein